MFPYRRSGAWPLIPNPVGMAYLAPRELWNKVILYDKIKELTSAQGRRPSQRCGERSGTERRTWRDRHSVAKIVTYRRCA